MFLTSWFIVLAVLLFWAVGAYNRLMRLRSSAIQAFGALDAELVRRTALLGEYDAVVTGPRLPADAQRHEALRASGTQFAASLAVMRSRPLDANAGTALSAAGKVLDAAWQSLVDAVQKPDSDVDASATMASLIQRSELQRAQIDIAVDLKGFTRGARSAVFAQRPAPVCVNYLGYPGTMGAA